MDWEPVELMSAKLIRKKPACEIPHFTSCPRPSITACRALTNPFQATMGFCATTLGIKIAWKAMCFAEVLQ